MSESCQIIRTERVTYDVLALGTGKVLQAGFAKWRNLPTPQAAQDAARALARDGEPCEVIATTEVITISRERVEVVGA